MISFLNIYIIFNFVSKTSLSFVSCKGSSFLTEINCSGAAFWKRCKCRLWQSFLQLCSKFLHKPTVLLTVLNMSAHYLSGHIVGTLPFFSDMHNRRDKETYKVFPCPKFQLRLVENIHQEDIVVQVRRGYKRLVLTQLFELMSAQTWSRNSFRFGNIMFYRNYFM